MYCKKTFPGSRISCCLFHFSQILWRRVKYRGLTRKYVENFRFNLGMKMIASLSFVPDCDVISMSEKLVEYFLNTGCDEDLVNFLFCSLKIILKTIATKE
jgi:hypothetical protein